MSDNLAAELLHYLFEDLNDPPANTTTTTCTACLEEIDIHDVINGPCGHTYCRQCTKTIFTSAEDHPPHCCGKRFPLATASLLLDQDELQAFNQKAIEWSTNGRLYCADRNCSQLIPPSNIENQMGTCPGCSQITHEPCRSLEHGEADCPADENTQGVLQLAAAERWMRCTRCGLMIDRIDGCRHIICRCGYQFCYHCGGEWQRCHCLIQTEHQAMMNQRRRRRPRRQPFHNPGIPWIQGGQPEPQYIPPCPHGGDDMWVLQTTGNLMCWDCGWVGHFYILACLNCQTRLCHNCLRNRLD